MAKIKITTGDRNEHEVQGRITFRTEKVETKDGSIELLTRGKMSTHYYIEDIAKIETDRYILEDIDVYAEEFGTNDFNILYEFYANDYIVKGGLTNLPQIMINALEDKEYKNDDSNQWEKGDDR